MQRIVFPGEVNIAIKIYFLQEIRKLIWQDVKKNSVIQYASVHSCVYQPQWVNNVTISLTFKTFTARLNFGHCVYPLYPHKLGFVDFTCC